MRTLDYDHLLMTDLHPDNQLTAEERGKELIRSLQGIFHDYEDRRGEKTKRMQECWALYLGTPEAEEWTRRLALHETVGDIEVDWRHKINRGKGYEIVETIVPYLKGATFPNDDWFDLVPAMHIDDEDYLMYIKIMKQFIKHKLDVAKFREKWEIFLRQLCIVGTSVLALPWRVETRKRKRNVKVWNDYGEGVTEVEIEKTIYNAPDINVEDMLHTFLDPDEPDPNCANLIRRMHLTRGQVARLVEDDVYDMIGPEDIKKIKAYTPTDTTDSDIVQDFVGLGPINPHKNDTLEVFEFWGSIHLSDVELSDVVITWVGDTLLRVDTNPYWCGKPFVVGTYTPITASPYGFGALEPVLGDLHEIDVLGNSRLDGLSISLLPTYFYRGDGTVDPTDLKVFPGKFIAVNGDITDIVKPMEHDLRFASVSSEEEMSRENSVDKRTGTGSFIGSAPGRSGERVTATEVDATRQAGGSRLSGVYEHIEITALVPTLEKSYGLMQQFIIEDETIPVPGRTPEEIIYAQVGVDQLAYDFFIKAKGAAHVADKEYELRQRTDWISIMNSNQQLAQYVDWKEVAKDITRRFTGEDASKFIKDEAEPPPAAPGEEMPMAPEADAAMGAAEAAGQIGGAELAQGVEAQMAADGGMNLAKPIQNTTVQQPVF